MKTLRGEGIVWWFKSRSQHSPFLMEVFDLGTATRQTPGCRHRRKGVSDDARGAACAAVELLFNLKLTSIQMSTVQRGKHRSHSLGADDNVRRCFERTLQQEAGALLEIE